VDFVMSAVLEREWTLNDNYYSKQKYQSQSISQTKFKMPVLQ